MNRGVLLGTPSPQVSQLTKIADADYYVQTNDRFVLWTTINTIRTATLPSASSFGVGELVIGDASGNINGTTRYITIATSSNDGIVTPATSAVASTLSIKALNGTVRLMSDGSKRWYIVGGYGHVAGDIANGGSLYDPTIMQVQGLYGKPLGPGVGSPGTNDIMVYDGTFWAGTQTLTNAGLFGAMQTYTPTLTQSGAVTKTVNVARYIQIGLVVYLWVKLTPTGTGTTNNAITVSLPINVHDTAMPVGAGVITLAGTQYRANVIATSSTVVAFRRADVTGTGNMGIDPNAALANSGDAVNFFAVYEAA